jgi:hypothetical protein
MRISSNLGRASLALPALLLASCFSLERLFDLEPGSVSGNAVQDDTGNAARFVRIVPEGTGLVRRARADGAFALTGLPAGGMLLRFSDDDDGDGFPERGALRAFSITPVTLGDKTQLASVLLGQVNLQGAGRVVGDHIARDGGGSAAGARVALFRTAADLARDDEATAAIVTTDVGAEALVNVDAAGSFIVPGASPGHLTVAMFVPPSGPAEAAAVVGVVVKPGEEARIDGAVLAPVDAAARAQIDVVVSRAANASADETVRVRLTAPGAAPTDDNTVAVIEGPQGAVLRIEAPIGVWDVHAATSSSTLRGFSGAQVALPTAGVARWGVTLLPFDPCASVDVLDARGGTLDRDADGVPSIPFSSFDACSATCDPLRGSALQEQGCTIDGVAFDCDDDGDDQADTAERSCLGVCAGNDADRDDLCSPQDDNPCCAGQCAAAQCDHITDTTSAAPFIARLSADATDEDLDDVEAGDFDDVVVAGTFFERAEIGVNGGLCVVEDAVVRGTRSAVVVAWLDAKSGACRRARVLAPAGAGGFVAHAGMARLADGTVGLLGRFGGVVDVGNGVAPVEDPGGNNSIYLAVFDKGGTPIALSAVHGTDQPLSTTRLTRSADGFAFAGSFSNFLTFAPESEAPVDLNAFDGFDLFVARYTKAGALSWVVSAQPTTAPNGSGVTAAEAYTVEGLDEGDVVISGAYGGQVFGGTSPLAPTLGDVQGFVARLAVEDGAFVWAVPAGLRNCCLGRAAPSVVDARPGSTLLATAGLLRSGEAAQFLTASQQTITLSPRPNGAGGYVVLLDATTGAALGPEAALFLDGRFDLRGVALVDDNALYVSGGIDGAGFLPTRGGGQLALEGSTTFEDALVGFVARVERGAGGQWSTAWATRAAGADVNELARVEDIDVLRDGSPIGVGALRAYTLFGALPAAARGVEDLNDGFAWHLLEDGSSGACKVGTRGPRIDTWLYDAGQDVWTEQVGASRFPALIGGAAAQANVTPQNGTEIGTTLLFGGTDGLQFFDDAWFWDGNDWTLLSFPEDQPRPSPRAYAALVYDFEFSFALLVGGENGDGDIDDAWALQTTATGAQWTQIAGTDVDAMPATSRAAASTDGFGNVIFFGGGTKGSTFRFSSTGLAEGAFTQLAVAGPPDRKEAVAAVDFGLIDGVVLMGGFSTDGVVLDDAWALRLNEQRDPVWEPLAFETTPPARAGAHLAQLPGGTLLLVGGVDVDGVELDDAWVLDTRALTWVERSKAPPARVHGALAVAELEGALTAVLTRGEAAIPDAVCAAFFARAP